MPEESFGKVYELPKHPNKVKCEIHTVNNIHWVSLKFTKTVNTVKANISLFAVNKMLLNGFQRRLTVIITV